jgi:hypothetical protein
VCLLVIDAPPAAGLSLAGSWLVLRFGDTLHKLKNVFKVCEVLIKALKVRKEITNFFVTILCDISFVGTFHKLRKCNLPNEITNCLKGQQEGSSGLASRTNLSRARRFEPGASSVPSTCMPCSLRTEAALSLQADAVSGFYRNTRGPLE